MHSTINAIDASIIMAIKTKDIIPINQVRSRFTELSEEVKAGDEKIITRNGEGYVTLIDTRRLDYYHRLEREHIHLTLLDEAMKGLDMSEIPDEQKMQVRGW